jgi:hypothetical protein
MSSNHLMCEWKPCQPSIINLIKGCQWLANWVNCLKLYIKNWIDIWMHEYCCRPQRWCAHRIWSIWKLIILKVEFIHDIWIKMGEKDYCMYLTCLAFNVSKFIPWTFKLGTFWFLIVWMLSIHNNVLQLFYGNIFKRNLKTSFLLTHLKKNGKPLKLFGVNNAY